MSESAEEPNRRPGTKFIMELPATKSDAPWKLALVEIPDVKPFIVACHPEHLPVLVPIPNAT